MISVDVRSWKVRPSASMPVTVSGTACTIRVVRRFCASASGLGMESDTPTPSISSLTPRTSGVERGTPIFPNSYGKNQHLLAYLRGVGARCRAIRYGAWNCSRGSRVWAPSSPQNVLRKNANFHTELMAIIFGRAARTLSAGMEYQRRPGSLRGNVGFPPAAANRTEPRGVAPQVRSLPQMIQRFF